MIAYAILAGVKRLAVAYLLWMGATAALAQSPGKFVVTGGMRTQRLAHTATLLRDGRVLVAGGMADRIELATAELYDPSTGTFTPTGNMNTARGYHAATLLPDGRLLIAGGLIGGNTAEIYDPATGRFTAIGNMAGSHEFPVANLLSNGKVLITGWPSAEIYDPATGVFTLLGPLDDGNSSAVLLRNGRVLIPNYKNVSLYNITTDSLQIASSSTTDGEYQTATVLTNGKVLIAGGDRDGIDATSDEASLYNPHSGTLEGTGLLLFSRDTHTATLLPGGRVLIAGGYNGDGYSTGMSDLPYAEQYDPSAGSFTLAGILNYSHALHTATLLPDGRVLITGGDRYHNPPAELYIPPLTAASSASLTGPLAPESQASLFGSRLAGATESANPPSLPTTLGGISLRVIDSSGTARMARLFYVSPSRIDFEVPAGTAAGQVTFEVVNARSEFNHATAQIDNVAPALFTHDDNTVVSYTTRFERRIPSDSHPVQLILYATGIRHRSSLANVQCTIGGISVPVDYAGPNDNGVPGLDQVNVTLIPTLKGGFQDLVLTVDGIPSNTVSINLVGPGRK